MSEVSSWTRGWGEGSLETTTATRFYLNEMPDHADRYIYGITQDSEISMKFEVYGCPSVEFGLCLFVENQPVSIDGKPFIPLSVERGMKTVVEGILRVPEFDGEAPVYAVLVPRTQLTNGLDGFGIHAPAGTFILLDLADMDELYELKGYK